MGHVIIPVLNERHGIDRVIRPFYYGGKCSVTIVVDRDSTDKTGEHLTRFGGWDSVPDVRVIRSPMHGKGENVLLALECVRTRDGFIPPRVILSDGDLQGITKEDVEWLADRQAQGIRIAVPRRPAEPEWLESGPGHSYERAMLSWPLVSGIRSVPTLWLKNIPLTGYLMEVQMNAQALQDHIPFDFRETNIISPLRFTPQRMEDMNRDYRKGIEMGLIKDA